MIVRFKHLGEIIGRSSERNGSGFVKTFSMTNRPQRLFIAAARISLASVSAGLDDKTYNSSSRSKSFSASGMSNSLGYVSVKVSKKVVSDLNVASTR